MTAPSLVPEKMPVVDSVTQGGQGPVTEDGQDAGARAIQVLHRTSHTSTSVGNLSVGWPTLLDGCADGAFRCPTQAQPTHEGVVLETALGRPFGGRVLNAGNGQRQSIRRDWRGDSVGPLPTAAQTFMECGLPDVASLSPFRHRQRLIADGAATVHARIAMLLSHRRPATIARRIRAVIVDAIQRTARRARPHVGIEPREARAPFVGHRDAPAAVVVEIVIARIVAAGFGAAPRTKFARVRHAVCLGHVAQGV